MNALIALFKVLDAIISLFNQWREEHQLKIRNKLESDAFAYEKLAKATKARQKSRLSRRKDISGARGKHSPDKLRNDKYRRD